MNCDCTETCRLMDWSDQFQSATRELMVFTKSKTRFFDLDSVREQLKESPGNRYPKVSQDWDQNSGKGAGFGTPVPPKEYSAGAPPLDWWLIPYTEPDSTPRQGEPMTATFYVGDAITVMNTLPEKSVDLILTSPPFLALRSYLPTDHANKALEIGSEPTPGAFVDRLLDVVEACARVLAPHGSLCFELGDTYSGSGGAGGDYSEGHFRDGQEVYIGSESRSRTGKFVNERYVEANRQAGFNPIPSRRPNVIPQKGTGWPLAKSLSLIPETFRFAMVYGHNPHTGRRTEPWRLRNVIRWVRPNPPVGALGDKFRPATSELMVFCKAKDRFFDLDAVREPVQFPDKTRTMGKKPGVTTDHKDANFPGDLEWVDKQGANNPAGAPPLDWWNIPSDAQVRTLNYVECGCTESCMMDEVPDQFQPATSELLVFCKSKTRFFDLDAVREPYAEITLKHHGGKTKEDGLINGPKMGTMRSMKRGMLTHEGAPPLDWWNIPPGGYPGAHYAVWPPELLVKPIKAMCPESVCRVCGEPRRRIEGQVRYVPSSNPNTQSSKAWADRPAGWDSGIARGKGAHSSKPDGGRVRTAETLGFSDCGHDNYRPGLVLDCFAGSGTTLSVATGHGRDAIGIDLDERNYELALDRVGPLILQRGEIRDGTGPPD